MAQVPLSWRWQNGFWALLLYLWGVSSYYEVDLRHSILLTSVCVSLRTGCCPLSGFHCLENLFDSHICALFPCWANRERHGSSDTLQPFCCPSVRVQGLLPMSHLGWGLHRLQTFRSWREHILPQCYSWQCPLVTNMNHFLTLCFNPGTLTLLFLVHLCYL